MSKHYGIWHPEQGWYWPSHSRLFVTENRAIAQAQLDIVRRQLFPAGTIDYGLYEVRQVEAWAMEQEQQET